MRPIEQRGWWGVAATSLQCVGVTSIAASLEHKNITHVTQEHLASPTRPAVWGCRVQNDEEEGNKWPTIMNPA